MDIIVSHFSLVHILGNNKLLMDIIISYFSLVHILNNDIMKHTNHVIAPPAMFEVCVQVFHFITFKI